MKKLQISFEKTVDATGYLFSFAKCLSAALACSAYADMAQDVIAASGFAFRMWAAQDLCPSAMSVWDFSMQPKWAEKGGLVCAYTQRLWGEENLEEERRLAAIAQIKTSIDAGVAAVVWDLGDCEWGLVTGYDEAGQLLFTLKTDGSEGSISWEKLGNLEIPILSVLTVAGRNDRTAKLLVEDAKQLAASHLRGEEWCENAAGLAAYEVLCAHLLEKWSEDLAWQLEYYLGTYGALKWYAWQFFKKYGEHECADIYEGVYRAWKAAFDLKRQGDVRDRALRERILELLKKAQAQEEKFLELVEF